MRDNVWICPHCDTFLGLNDYLFENDSLFYCHHCGHKFQLMDVPFLDFNIVQRFREIVRRYIIDEFQKYTYLRWLSTHTVSIIVEEDPEHFLSLYNFDFEKKMEEEIADEFGLDINVIFDYP